MVSEKKERTFQGNSSQNNNLIAALAYIIFFIPILVAKEDKFAMYHANQGLLLLLMAIGINVVGTIIPIFGWFLILPLGNIFVLVLTIIGFLSAYKGEKKPLPLIGGYTILE
ncbi:MAG: hypothetical protein IPN70_02810 [Candidatus Moraniibacteriota bacterium]|nr:MAG: hypothetical protein IPN70_02810 [Candidatus Moranbacteria bacterium]